MIHCRVFELLIVTTVTRSPLRDYVTMVTIESLFLLVCGKRDAEHAAVAPMSESLNQDTATSEAGGDAFELISEAFWRFRPVRAVDALLST